MKTTKQYIKDRIMNDDRTLTEENAQIFVDKLFPNTGMNIIVETTDEDMKDEAKGKVGTIINN